MDLSCTQTFNTTYQSVLPSIDYHYLARHTAPPLPIIGMWIDTFTLLADPSRIFLGLLQLSIIQ